MKDDNRKMFVRLAFVIAAASIGGTLLVVMIRPLVFGSARPADELIAWMTFTILTVVGGFACLVAGRGHLSQYVVLVLIWVLWLVFLLQPPPYQ